jgi:plastocyanin
MNRWLRRVHCLVVVVVLVLAALAPGVARAGVEHQVSLLGSVFTPQHLEITAGDSVRWTNDDAPMFHNVRADDGSFRCAEGCDDLGGDGGVSPAPWTFSRVFTEPGVIGYYCEAHGVPGLGMWGTITVLEEDPTIFVSGFESGDFEGWSAVVGD